MDDILKFSQLTNDHLDYIKVILFGNSKIDHRMDGEKIIFSQIGVAVYLWLNSRNEIVVSGCKSPVNITRLQRYLENGTEIFDEHNKRCRIPGGKSF